MRTENVKLRLHLDITAVRGSLDLIAMLDVHKGMDSLEDDTLAAVCLAAISRLDALAEAVDQL